MDHDASRDRREGDERIQRIEQLVRDLTAEVGKIRNRLGERNTTLIYDLDERYLTRKDAQEFYVSRKEHEADRRENRSVMRDRILVAVAASGYLTGLVEFIATRH